jgi:hypothetical protein
MEELWKVIDDFPNYMISNLGNLKSKITDKILKQQVNNNYLAVSFGNTKTKKKTYRVHRLVAKYFIPNPNNLGVVNHIDGNKKNNRWDNLEWNTQTQNVYHAVDNGLWNSQKGSKSGKSKLTEEQVIEIKKRLFNENYSVIAKDYKVSSTTIYSIWKGISWSWLD